MAAALGGGACGGLKSLFLDDNEIGEGGAVAVAAALVAGRAGA